MTEPYDEYFFSRLYQSFKPMVMNYCCLNLSVKETDSDVQDIVHDIFIEVFQSINEKRVTNISLLRSYIVHIARRACIRRKMVVHASKK